MTKILLKRVYDDWNENDGYRVLVDRLWPRGLKKESLHYDLWAKDLTPSTELRKWFHQDINENWNKFTELYQKELDGNESVPLLLEEIKKHETVTLLYASKEKEHNHALILKDYMLKYLK